MSLLYKTALQVLS